MVTDLDLGRFSVRCAHACNADPLHSMQVFPRCLNSRLIDEAWEQPPPPPPPPPNTTATPYAHTHALFQLPSPMTDPSRCAGSDGSFCRPQNWLGIVIMCLIVAYHFVIAEPASKA